MGSAPQVVSVSRLTALLQEVVEDNFFQVLVEGEISNFSTPVSGHWYFCLKDAGAQLRGVMFRTQNRLLRFRPENGMRVLVGGRVSVYQQRGELQLIVESLEPQGVGSLQLAFEQCKARLAAEGLFDAQRKRPLPPFPRCVGVVTSATGAAIHDLMQVLRRRHAGVRVLLRPVRVQGEGAAGEIAEAIADFNRHGEADVLIVGRGGGSMEDLWAFNEEIVARAISASALPVIAAVGHETDFTIADFVADLRAPTPSAAAELVIKSRLELENHLDHLAQRLGRQMDGRLRMVRERVESLGKRLISPRQELLRYRQRQEDLTRRLQRAMDRRRTEAEGRLAALAGRLDILSPLRTLERGYAIVFTEQSGRAVRAADELATGDRVRLRFAAGGARAIIEKVEP
ncbi:MAG: exodeoxyribonuclease VII large subunit [Desulfuromonadales bacterium]